MPKWLGITVLSVLAIITVAVVMLATLHMRAEIPNAGSLPEGSEPAAVEPTPEPEPEPEPTPEPPVEEPVVAPVSQRLLAVTADEAHLLRAYIGACPEPVGIIESSFDNGASWQQGSTAAIGATKILQFETITPSMDRLVALGSDCEVVHARSFIGGVDWASNDAVGAWYVDQTDAAAIMTPSGPQTLPCEAVGLASADARAIVLCKDSTLTVSTDLGATWVQPVAVPHGAAVGTTPAGFIVASVAEPECAGVRTRTFDGAALGEPGVCVERDDAGDGKIAVTGSASASYLWAGDAFLRSSDQGQTWS